MQMPTSPVARSATALGLALALGAGLAGCGADTGAARSTIEKVQAPSIDWKPGGQGVERFGTKDVAASGGIRVYRGSTYLTGWDVVVAPGHEGERCEQAARWLKKTGQGFTGNVVDPNAKTASLEEMVVACLQALKPLAAGASTTIGFATWPTQQNGDYRFEAGIGARVTGTELRVYAAADAAPQG